MHVAGHTEAAGHRPDWRHADAQRIAGALREVRRHTLQVFDAYLAAGALHVPRSEELNPPLWELGHIGWFQERWIGRNQQRHLGVRCEPAHARWPSLLAGSDDWYDSSTVPHTLRWDLPLPEPDTCKAYLAATLEQTLTRLQTAGQEDDALYFYRLVLFHEAMHLEAAIYMAQAVGVPLNPMLIATHLIANNPYFTPAISQKSIPATDWMLGWPTDGFAFDNELGAHTVQLAAFEIDSQAVRWRQYLQFVQATKHALPRYVRQTAQGYEHQHFGHWQRLDLQAAAVHLGWHDAQAYCTWAGRRLPTEAEWECAALSSAAARPESASNGAWFTWGEVWEWSSSTFTPYPGFTAHPYRDYSEPWFHSRPVLRGACLATQPTMRNARYRNYFMADRTDIFAGFRTCSL